MNTYAILGVPYDTYNILHPKNPSLVIKPPTLLTFRLPDPMFQRVHEGPAD